MPLNNHLYKLSFSLFILFSITINYSFSQYPKHILKYTQTIKPDSFNPDLLVEIIYKEINKHRIIKGLDSLKENKILKKASEDQAEYMAFNRFTTLEQSGKKKTTGDRAIYYGGSRKVTEDVMKMPVKKGKELFTYKKVADDIIFKWLTGKNSAEIFYNPNYIFIGIGAEIDNYGSKTYISAVLGNYSSFNYGVNRRKELKVPFSTNEYGLMPFDPDECKNCNKFRNIEKLQKGLYVKNNKIYFKYDNLKALNKLIKNPEDALAVDVIQKEQYSCNGNNIIDNNLINKGILLKPIFSKKLYQKNLISGKKVEKINVCMGKFPKGITGNYELNLLVIQNKHVCRNLSNTFIIEAGVVYSSSIDLIADTVTIYTEMDFVPVAESTVLSFRIPFEVKKSFTWE